MERIAIIENDTVVNVVKAPAGWADPSGRETVSAPRGSGVEIGAERQEDGSWKVPGPTLEELRTKTRIPRAKFAVAAAKAGLITEAEAEEWAAGAANPQWVSDAIEAAVAAGAIPEDERLEARIAVRTQDTIGRNDRLIPILADSADLSPEQVDALFGINV